MICDVSDPEFFAEWCPAALFDATGARIHGLIVWADTETGDVAVICHPPRTVADDTGEETLAMEWKSYPPPLTIERIKT